jgi:DNA methylase
MNPRLPNEMRYAALVGAAQAANKVSSLTHSFYRYPARFGETFVREAVQSFSREGETVLDPFCGGGTTVVEALVAGRGAIGADLSELALFITRVKTTPLSQRQLQTIRAWLDDATADVKSLLLAHSDKADARLSNVPGRYRNLLAALRERVHQLPKGHCRTFASCLLLKTGQWAFDGKELLPTPRQMVTRLRESFDEMHVGMTAYANQLRESGASKHQILRRRQLHLCRAETLSLRALGLEKPSVSLVVTSPPYPGVHVLYHRWQVRGRRETRAPFFVTGHEDLGGASAYTIVDRSSKTKERYFASIESSFRAVRALLRDDAYVIQLVSFANAGQSLPQYLAAMANAGLQLCESYLKSSRTLLWRSVPGRRWYARVGAVSDSSASNEVLLVHRKAR